MGEVAIYPYGLRSELDDLESKENVVAEAFIASNGLAIIPNKDGSVWWEAGHAFTRVTQALREFFLHERDQELGRWRWPEDRNYVVYPNPVADHELAFGDDLSLIILRESDGVMKGYAQDEDHHRNPERGSEFARAARAYFAAHPEPKPWHEAKPGEVWEVTIEGEPYTLEMTCIDHDGDVLFFTKDQVILTHYSGIMAAERLWPEED